MVFKILLAKETKVRAGCVWPWACKLLSNLTFKILHLISSDVFYILLRYVGLSDNENTDFKVKWIFDLELSLNYVAALVTVNTYFYIKRIYRLVKF